VNTHSSDIITAPLIKGMYITYIAGLREHYMVKFNVSIHLHI